MFNFKHKDEEFFDLFVDSANYFNNCAIIMNEVMRDYSKADGLMKQIIDLEHDADDINDRIIDKLNQTFITPIDREDIYALATGLDDGVDFLQGTLQRMVMYRTGPAREGAIELTQLLIECTEEISKAFVLMKDIRKNQGDRLYRKEVAHLFDCCKDPIEIIKWKEVLEYLENTLDHCEDIADLIRGVVMKYA